jgi:hypothetical protein
MRLKAFWIAVFLAFLLGVGPPAASAATNRVFGGIGGINNGTIFGGDGTGAAEITINTTQLALVKQARNLAGNVIPDGSNVASNSTIYFVLYVDNTTDAEAFDVQMRDQLNESWFLYQSGTLETTEVPSGSNDAAIWSGLWSPLFDPQDADACSAINTSGVTNPEPDLITCGSDTTQPNPRMPVPAGTLKAIRFQVEVR